MLPLLVAFALLALANAASARASVASPAASPAYHEYFAAPNGTAQGDGSRTNPWDLQTALNQPPTVQPGDKIWMRGGVYQGTYYSRLRGTSTALITLAGYTGERAIIDKARVDIPDHPLYVAGTYAIYRDFEVTNSSPVRTNATEPLYRGNGVTVFGPYNKFVNLVVHDTECGFGFWKESLGSEIYGSIIYNNGIVTNGVEEGHGIYADNTTDTKRIVDNVIGNNFSYGVHIYSEAEPLSGFHIEGNVLALNGMPNGSPQANLLIGGNYPADHIEILNNHAYYPLDTGQTGINLHLGGWGASDSDYVARGNYLSGGYWAAYGPDWQSTEFTGNTLHGARLLWQLNARSVNITSRVWDSNRYLYAGSGPTQFKLYGSLLGYADWRRNSGFDANSTYSTSMPSAPEVIVRPNQYEPGRANIIVWNWTNEPTVQVNLSGVIAVGARYEIRNAFNYFALPVASGTYQGGTVPVPMSALTVATPTGWTPPSYSTAPAFGTFVVRTPQCAGTIEFNKLRAAFGSVYGYPNYDPTVDYNNDQRVDSQDYLILRGRFGVC